MFPARMGVGSETWRYCDAVLPVMLPAPEAEPLAPEAETPRRKLSPLAPKAATPRRKWRRHAGG